MTKEVYAKKFKDPRWQKKRLRILERDGFRCKLCGDDESTLHVHHRYYIAGKDPWEYEDEALVTLCESCHANEAVAMAEAVLAIKMNLFGHEAQLIAEGVCDNKIEYGGIIACEVIKWALGDEGLCKQMVDLYFASLSNNKEVLL